jgi:glucose-1-phosphate adenylyltransferase
MDFAKMAEFHMQNKADITVAVQPVSVADAGRFGILKRNSESRIIDFVEKPTDPQVLKQVASRNDPQKPYLGSMGIYLFNTEVLTELLSNPSLDDFGAHVIPNSIKTHTVFGYDYDGFWEDIGTIRSFYETNLMLTEKNPPFNFFDQKFPIYTHPRFLPGSTIEDSILKDVLLAEGCCIERASITHSVIGLRSQIRSNTVIADSVLMGNDYYEKLGSPEAVHGALNNGVVIQPFPKGTNIDGDGWVVRDGIVVIPKSGVIKPGTRIAP